MSHCPKGRHLADLLATAKAALDETRRLGITGSDLVWKTGDHRAVASKLAHHVGGCGVCAR